MVKVVYCHKWYYFLWVINWINVLWFVEIKSKEQGRNLYFDDLWTNETKFFEFSWDLGFELRYVSEFQPHLESTVP